MTFKIDELPFDHVGIAVTSIDENRRTYELLTGASSSETITVTGQGVRVAFIGSVELLEPLGPDTPVGRFLARRGSGMHHVAFRSENLEADLDRLRELGFTLIDHEPRQGAHGRVAFLHPTSTGGVLVELIQHD